MDTSTATITSSNKKRKHVKDLPVLGISDFEDFMDDEAQSPFIDKTMFIKDWMENGVGVSVFLRPRRFGKSINLSMLKSFFCINDKPQDYSKYLIGKESEFITKHCHKYPVVYMSMKGIGGDNWEEMLKEIWLRLKKVMIQHESTLTQDNVKYIGVSCYDANTQPDEAIAVGFLDKLIDRLHNKHNQKVIVLIDEYDAPLNLAFRNSFHDKASKFFGRFYTNGLKDNFSLKRACLMGIVEVRGSGIFSELSNLVMFPSTEDQYSEYFGFTREEIETVTNGQDYFDNINTSMQDVLEWYNGYFMGSHQMINPWSFMSFLRFGETKSYWTRTANLDSLHAVVRPALRVQFIKILGQFFDGNKYDVGELTSKADYSNIAHDSQSALGLLVHLGYLTYKDSQVSIPNKEVRLEWKNHVLGLSQTIVNSKLSESLSTALNAQPPDFLALESAMKETLNYCTYHDEKTENSYHMYYYGMFIVACGASNLKSNMESGGGRYDIQIAFPDLKRLIIFELKRSKKIGTLNIDAKKGLNQILEKNYYNDPMYIGWTCFAIGVSFFAKVMSKLEYTQLKL